MATPEAAYQAEWAELSRISRLLDQIAENAKVHLRYEFSHDDYDGAITRQYEALPTHPYKWPTLRLELVNLAGLALAWLAQIDAEGVT